MLFQPIFPLFEAPNIIPVITVNGDLWPINFEANRRHMFSFHAIVLKKVDHFLMMDRPVDFNKALEKAILMLVGK